MKKWPSLKHLNLNLNLNDASGKEGGAPDQVPTPAALPSEGPAGSAAPESVHVADNRAPSKKGKGTRAGRLIQQRHVHRALKVAGAPEEVIHETEAMLRKHRHQFPVLVALQDYGWLLQEGMGKLQFDEKVVPALMAAIQDRSHVSPDMLMYPDDIVEEFLDAPVTREEYDLSDEDVNALMVQLRGLDSLQRLALSRTVDAASDLRSGSSMSAVDACRALGLRVN